MAAHASARASISSGTAPSHAANFTVPHGGVKDKGIYLSILKQAGIEDEGVS